MVLAYLVPLYSRYDGVIAPWDVLNIQEHLVTHYFYYYEYQTYQGEPIHSRSTDSIMQQIRQIRFFYCMHVFVARGERRAPVFHLSIS